LALFERVHTLTQRYGRTPAKLERALAHFAKILGQFGCGATFPVTAVTLERNGSVLSHYKAHPIEFAVHGYTHVDYAQLTPNELLSHLQRACETFAQAGLKATGFRSPYLSRNPSLEAALEANGFSYVSNQPILWQVLDKDNLKPASSSRLERAVGFYDPWDASQYPSLPRLRGKLVDIPVSLPDDEILLERLRGEPDGLMENAWRRILSRTYERGELFTLMLHPERIAWCAEALSEVLAEARELAPQVWIARLDDIAAWWRARASAAVQIRTLDDGAFRVEIGGPRGTIALVRHVGVDQPTVAWVQGYEWVMATSFTVHSPYHHRPFIGVSVDASPNLSNFLRQQGYIIEINDERDLYAHYFEQTEFLVEQERPLLAQLEGANHPLVRLGRWPEGARSALAISGDIDALTLWDYGLRFLGR
jgi:peptidoglycan/xylan/chitin deacetylase (PgdA/CDA1 family)